MKHLSRAIRSTPRTRGAAASVALLLVLACSSRAPGVARHVVDIRAFGYAPRTLTVSVGDTVIWSNHDPVPHTATGPRARWDTGEIRANASARWVADRPGTEEYVCAYHPNMRATLVIRPDG